MSHARHTRNRRSPDAAAAAIAAAPAAADDTASDAEAVSAARAAAFFSSPSPHRSDRRAFFLRATELAQRCDEEEQEEEEEAPDQPQADSLAAQQHPAPSQSQHQPQRTDETQQLAAAPLPLLPLQPPPLPAARSARRSRIAPHSAAAASPAHAASTRRSVAQSSRSGGQAAAAAASSVAFSARAARPAATAGVGLSFVSLDAHAFDSGVSFEEPSLKRARKLDFSGSASLEGAEDHASAAAATAATDASFGNSLQSSSIHAAAVPASSESSLHLVSLDLEMSLDHDPSLGAVVDVVSAAAAAAAASSSLSHAQSRSFEESSRPLSQSPSLVSSPRIVLPSSSLSSQLSQSSQPLQPQLLEPEPLWLDPAAAAAAMDPPTDVLIPPSSAEHSAGSSQEADPARVPSPSLEMSLLPPLQACPSIPPSPSLGHPSQEPEHVAGQQSPIPSTPLSRCASPLPAAAAVRMHPLPLPLPLPLPPSQTSQSPSLHSLGGDFPAPSLLQHTPAPSVPAPANEFGLTSAVVSPALAAFASRFSQSQQLVHAHLRHCTQPSSADAESFSDIELPSQLMGSATAAPLARGGVVAPLMGSQQQRHLLPHLHRSSQHQALSSQPSFGFGMSPSPSYSHGLGVPASIPFHASPPIVTAAEAEAATIPASASSSSAAALQAASAAEPIAVSDPTYEPAYDPFKMLAPLICEADLDSSEVAADTSAAAASHLASLSSIHASYPAWLRKCESVLRVLRASRLHPFVFTHLSMLHALLVGGAVPHEAMPPFDAGVPVAAAAEKPLRGLGGRFEVYDERNPRPAVEGVPSGCWEWLRAVDVAELHRRGQARMQQTAQPRAAQAEQGPAPVVPSAPVAAPMPLAAPIPSASSPSTGALRRPASGSHARRPPRPPAPPPLPLPLFSQDSHMS